MNHPSQYQQSGPLQVLRVDASARQSDSVSRSLGDALLAALDERHGRFTLTTRDLAGTPPAFVDAAWVAAGFTPAGERGVAQQEALADSDALVRELMAADILVIGVPIYNFGIPATLKAWVDMVARARLTFRYTENGVEGLLKGKRAYLVAASGGVPVGSDIDFAIPYLRHVLAFLGITDVDVIAADQLNRRGEEAVEQARRQIRALVPPRATADGAVVSAA